MSRAAQLAFGPFRLDPARMELWRGTQPIALQRQPLAVLHYLLTNAGRVVPSEELLRQAWGGSHVSRTTLKVCVRAIRVALGDDASDPQYVETVGREGYRFLVVGHVGARETDDERGSERPIVGRDHVLVELAAFAARAKQAQRQLVFVSGEPGIGKTTVIDLFLEQIASGRMVSIGRGQCLEQYGEGEAYLPVLEALAQVCRAPGGRAVIDVLRSHAPTWLVQMPSLVSEGDVEALQRRVADATRDRMLREMADALDAVTAERTLVLVFEDLHWSDRSTVDLLAHVARRRERAQLLLIGTFRPVELIVGRHPLLDVKRELTAHGHASELALELLVEQDVLEYLTQRLGNARASAPLARELHRRTDGNPLFLVNLVDDDLARGAVPPLVSSDGGREGGDVVPEGIQQTVARQIDRRSPGARSVLEAASVVGIEFSAAAVAACLDLEPEHVESVCEELVHEGHFLRAAGVAAWRDGTVSGSFAFRHALYQHVLYQRVPVSRRVRLHRRIAAREERGHGDGASAIAARLASHFRRGHDHERAAHYATLAAENAIRRNAYPEAARHFADAIDVLQGLPGSRERTRQDFVLHARLAAALMVVHGADAAEVDGPSTRALELLGELPDDPELVAVMDNLRGIYLNRGDLHRARALAERTLAIARNGTDVMQLGTALYGAGAIALFCGDFALARERLGQIIAFAAAAPPATDAATMQHSLLVAQALFAGALWFAGFPDEAAQRIAAALASAQQVGHPLTLANVQLFATIVHLGRDELDEVHRHAAASRATAEAHGLLTLLPGATILEGWALVRRGQKARGLAQIRKGFADYDATSGALFRPWLLALLAQALVDVGEHDEALAALEQAIATSERTGERTCAAEFLRMKGEMLLARPAASAARARGRRRPARAATAEVEGYFLGAIDTAREQGARSWELRAATSLSRLRREQGREEEAYEILAAVYDGFSEGLDTPDLLAARTLLEQLGRSSRA